MEKLTFKLNTFEGPLDLLLHLISKNKLNLYDIPVLELVDQYLQYLHEIKEMDMDIASEFLEMAARLIHMKTVMLLPKHEESEELKRELTGQLLEYRLCREIAGQLGERASGFDHFCREPEKLESDETYTGSHDPFVLLEAYGAAVGKGERKLPPPRTAFQGIVSRKIVSVSSKIISVLRGLRKNASVTYKSLFQRAESRSELVATFLAVLELVKARRIRVTGGEEDAEIRIITQEGK